MKKPILVSLILLNLSFKALMLEAPTACWSSWFRLLITLLEKKILTAVPCTPKFNYYCCDLYRAVRSFHRHHRRRLSTITWHPFSAIVGAESRRRLTANRSVTTPSTTQNLVTSQRDSSRW